ncbi:MAG: cytochrome-c peroxidase [Planctomycetia bacterium]|nr:cytochrome-c peroxidase [Planctomycetia bacterium]
MNTPSTSNPMVHRPLARRTSRHADQPRPRTASVVRWLIVLGTLSLPSAGVCQIVTPPVEVADKPRVDPVADPDGLRAEVRSYLVDSLKTVPVPLPSTITEFVKDQRAAVALGKALFWDQQAGSDGMACASCHFHAGADSRARNQISPGMIGGNGTFDRLPSGPKAGGPNYTLTRGDFPLHRKADPHRRALGTNVAFDTDDVVSSSGVAHAGLQKLGPQVIRSPKTPPVTQDIVTNQANQRAGIVPSSATNATIVPPSARRPPPRTSVAELFNTAQADPLGFSITVAGKKLNTRRVEPRNTPTVINAIFTHRNFWDGRANFHFNGRNPFGPRDPDAKVWKYAGSRLDSVAILLDNASLASQAVGPVESVLEMSAHDRNFLHVGRKLLLSTPLLQQSVSPSDSVLAPYARSIPTATRTGLKVGYGDLIKQAFVDQWWAAPGEPIVIDGTSYSQMEANFSLFWGIAIMLYERTLVSDDAPFDRFMEGDNSALTAQQRTGLSLFLHEGKCVNCHTGAEFTSASISHLKSPERPIGGFGSDSPTASPSTRLQLIERMRMQMGTAIYDGGFYNIGVRPALEDPGVGGPDAFGNPLSFSAQATGVGKIVDVAPPFADPVKFAAGAGRPPAPGEPISVMGSFKTPSLRNIDLTGPYFHNGGMLTLEQVVQFYARGSDFADWNRAHGIETDADIEVLPVLNGDREKIRAVAAFLRSLTDPRVAYERAPFDHPSLSLPDGHVSAAHATMPGVARSTMVVKPAVGAVGNPQPIQPFLGGSLVGPDGVPRDDGIR